MLNNYEEQLLSMYNSDKKISEIIQDLKLPKYIVQEMLTQLYAKYDLVPIAQKAFHLKLEQQKKDFLDLYRQGYQLQEIRKKMKLSVQIDVASLCRENGLETPAERRGRIQSEKYSKRLEQLSVEVIALYNQGTSIRKICETRNLEKSIVYKILNIYKSQLTEVRHSNLKEALEEKIIKPNKHELRRDRIKNLFTYDDIKDLFIETRHDEKKMCEMLNCTRYEMYRWIELNGYKKTDFISHEQVQIFRKEKAEQTALKRYGTKYPTGHPKIRKKIKNTLSSRYDGNYRNVNQIPEVQKRRKEISQERHGVSHPSKLKWVKDKKMKTCIKKYGVSSTFQIGEPQFVSKPEKEVVSYLETFYKGKIITNTSKIISPFELDIYLPEHNVAIEFNGSYWHSFDVMKRGSDKSNREIQFYHQNKFRMAEEREITLYSIWEFDWNRPEKQEIIKSQLRYLLWYRGENFRRISGHKTEIRRVEKKEAKDFLNKYHIQGASQLYTQRDLNGELLNFGLYYKDELLSIMTFGKWRRGRIAEYEIFRMCNKTDVSIIGGPQKLFNEFLRVVDPKSVGSYSSCSIGSGNFHKHLGFNFVRFTEPSYVRIDKSGEVKTLFSKDQEGMKIYLAGNKLWLYEKESLNERVSS